MRPSSALGAPQTASGADSTVCKASGKTGAVIYSLGVPAVYTTPLQPSSCYHGMTPRHYITGATVAPATLKCKWANVTSRRVRQLLKRTKKRKMKDDARRRAENGLRRSNGRCNAVALNAEEHLTMGEMIIGSSVSGFVWTLFKDLLIPVLPSVGGQRLLVVKYNVITCRKQMCLV